MTRLIVTAGRYTVIQEESGELYALRDGHRWRELTGDKFVLELAHRIRSLERGSAARE